MKGITVIFCFLISVANVIQCISPASFQQQVSDSNNGFSVELYKKLLKPEENLICSPFSVSTVLSMLWGGGNGLTATEIQKTLQYDNLTQNNVDSGYKTILKSLQSTNEYNLAVANGIFVKPQFQVLQSYINSVKTNYYAEVLDLQSVDTVNKWAKDKTKNLIPKILDSLPENAVMVLANAVYFKGTWQTKFDESKTLSENFKNNDSGDKKTSLMHLKSYFQYSESPELNAQVLHLPYEGSDMFMIVFLPQSGSKLVDMENKLTETALKTSINRNAKNQTVIVTLPKFEVESTLNLNDPLQALGMKEAFSDGADFSQISSEKGKDIKVSKVVQKALIKVSEEGTVAAAVTAVVIITKALPSPPEITVFNANHPFLYVLYHKPTDTILFMGRYSKV